MAPALTSPSSRSRLASALAASVLLHGVAIVAVRAGAGPASGSGRPQGMLHVSLVPSLSQSPDFSREQSAVADKPGSLQATAVMPIQPARPARSGGSGSLVLDLSMAKEYYLASRVHKPPQLQKRVDFTYPENVQAQIGVVTARVLIGESGAVEGVAVGTSEPAGIYDAAAVDALMQWRFSPGLMHGRAVPTQILVEVRFSASDQVPPIFATLLSPP